jgi:hypothetical protein
MKPNFLFAAMILLGVLSLAAAGCATVPQEKYDALLAEKNRLEAEKKDLADKNSELLEAVAELRDRGGANKLELNSEVEGRADYDLGDADLWEIQVEKEGTLHIRLEIQESGKDLDIELYGKTSESAEETDVEEMDVAVQPGTYYLRVFGYESGNASDYKLSASFEADVAESPEVPDALEFSLNSEVEGEIESGEEDWWALEIEDDGSLQIVLEILEAEVDLDLELYNENRELIAESIGETDIEEISVDVRPGVYYIKVFGYDSESSYVLSNSFE